MDPYFPLGPYTRSITTHSDEAQIWFNRGLNWCYAFHHKEAIRCFEKTVELDPDCAMGYWGIAYATGPYYNIPWDKMSPSGRPTAIATCYENVQKAVQVAANGDATAVEKALCGALSRRFQASSAADFEVLSLWDDDYANAMREVYRDLAEDDDRCALTAEALIVRKPWKLWDLQNRVPAEGADTLEAIEIIETALARIERNNSAQHAGLLHFNIHIM